jgi:hypothetical protein
MRALQRTAIAAILVVGKGFAAMAHSLDGSVANVKAP